MAEQYGLYNNAPVIRTFTGNWINVFDPKEDQINIEDIAHALSNLCRYGGHTRCFYSVAQHSVHCAELLRNTSIQLQFDALMHDSSEAYLMDFPRPIKLKMAEYKIIEDGLMKVIAKKFGVQYPFNEKHGFSPVVKEADEMMLNLEWESLMMGQHNNVKPVSPEKAKDRFLNRFYHFKQLQST